MNYELSLRRILFLTIMFISHEGYAAYYTRLGRRAILPTPFTGPMKTPSVKPSLPTSIGMRTFSQTETRQLSTYRPSFWNQSSQSMQGAKIQICEGPFKREFSLSDDLKEKGPLLLYNAVQKGDIERVKKLIDAGVNPMQNSTISGAAFKMGSKNNPLWLALGKRRAEIALYMVQNYPINYEQVIEGETPLSKALSMAITIGGGSSSDPMLQVIEAMLKNGASLSTYRLTSDKTPYLERAIQLMSPEVVDVLIEAGADVNGITHDNVSYLEETLRSGYYLTIADRLVRAGANINGLSRLPEYKNTKVSFLSAAIRENDQRVFRFLIDYGADVNNKEGLSPVLTAIAFADDPYYLKKLLKAGAYVDQRTIEFAKLHSKAAWSNIIAQAIQDRAVKKASIEDLD